jgi:hypothetical protein
VFSPEPLFYSTSLNTAKLVGVLYSAGCLELAGLARPRSLDAVKLLSSACATVGEYLPLHRATL